MGGAYDLAEAKAAFDAAPAISIADYEQDVASQDIRRGMPTGQEIQPREAQEVPDISLPPREVTLPLGEGAVRARLTLGQGCVGLPTVKGRQVLIVAAFSDAIPESDVIFQTRQYQGELALCIEEAGGDPTFQTRVSVPSLTAPSEILIYTS